MRDKKKPRSRFRRSLRPVRLRSMSCEPKTRLRRRSRRATSNTRRLRWVNQAQSWSKVLNNIPLKDGDYPGTKNVTRMKTAIQNQAEFARRTQAS